MKHELELRTPILADGETVIHDYRVTVSEDGEMYLLWVTAETDDEDTGGQSVEYVVYGFRISKSPKAVC